MPGPIRVLLVDDHAILRSGLRMLIEAQDDMQVVGEAGDVGATLRLAKSLAPDVITLDLNLPDGSGLGALERLRDAAPEARILVLTMHEDAAMVRSAVAMGASGFLAKSAADTALISAIRAVHRGRLFIDIPDAKAAAAVAEARGAPAPKTPHGLLSARERKVLALVARGHTNRAIAAELALSVKTVESYRARVMKKLGLETRADLTRVAMELGLLQ